MNCNRTRQFIEDIESGRLSEEQQKVLYSHLAVCRECRAFVGHLEGRPNEIPQEDWELLTRRVMEKTTGPACKQARNLLGEWLDGGLSIDDSHMLNQHLMHCSGCRSLADTLASLQVELPGLAELEPEPGFAEKVLAVTSGLRRPDFLLPAPRMAWWQRLTSRPRFAWEAAYAGVLLLLAVFQLSSVLPDNLSPRSALERHATRYAMTDTWRPHLAAGSSAGRKYVERLTYSAISMISGVEPILAEGALEVKYQAFSVWSASSGCAIEGIRRVRERTLNVFERIRNRQTANLSDGRYV